MQANNRDAASLWDMVQAIHRIQEFTAGLSFDDYQASILIQSAVERQLEILGEAAGRVSDALRQTYSTIDWRRTVGLRNIIIHRYDEIQARHYLEHHHYRTGNASNTARTSVTTLT
jgi:uncharacterized protein with HEPN domain